LDELTSLDDLDIPASPHVMRRRATKPMLTHIEDGHFARV